MLIYIQIYVRMYVIQAASDIHSHHILRTITCIQVATSHLAMQHIRPNSGAAELLSLHEVRHELHGQREDDGGVPLRRDGVEGLQVAELQGRRWLCDDQRRLFEGAGGVHLALCSDNLQTGSKGTLAPAHISLAVDLSWCRPLLWPHETPLPQQPWLFAFAGAAWRL